MLELVRQHTLATLIEAEDDELTLSVRRLPQRGQDEVVAGEGERDAAALNERSRLGDRPNRGLADLGAHGRSAASGRFVRGTRMDSSAAGAARLASVPANAPAIEAAAKATQTAVLPATL